MSFQSKFPLLADFLFDSYFGPFFLVCAGLLIAFTVAVVAIAMVS